MSQVSHALTVRHTPNHCANTKLELLMLSDMHPATAIVQAVGRCMIVACLLLGIRTHGGLWGNQPHKWTVRLCITKSEYILHADCACTRLQSALEVEQALRKLT